MYKISTTNYTGNVELPMVFRQDCRNPMTDAARKSAHGKRNAPKLFIYFDISGAFVSAIMTADESEFIVNNSMAKAVLLYIGLYTIANVGFPGRWFNFLALLEHAFLEMPFKGAKYVPIKLQRWITKFQES